MTTDFLVMHNVRGERGEREIIRTRARRRSTFQQQDLFYNTNLLMPPVKPSRHKGGKDERQGGEMEHLPINIVEHILGNLSGTSLPCTSSTSITQHYAVARSITQHHLEHTTLRSTTQHYAALRSTTQHYAALRSTTQHYAALRSITQHHTAPHNSTQHHHYTDILVAVSDLAISVVKVSKRIRKLVLQSNNMWLDAYSVTWNTNKANMYPPPSFLSLHPLLSYSCTIISFIPLSPLPLSLLHLGIRVHHGGE